MVQAPPATPQAVLPMAAHAFIALQQKPWPQLAPPMPTVHVEVHVPAAQVGVPAPQATQVPPLLPHAVPSVPGWQKPPMACEQQPPLHGVFTSQPALQRWLKRAHA